MRQGRGRAPAVLQEIRANATVLRRTEGDPLAAGGAVQSEVHKIDPSQAVFGMRSMQQVIEEETSGVRGAAISMMTYAFIALFLATGGIYSVISYSMAQRTHEIGIRMALGAHPRNVRGMAVADALRIAGTGIAIGLPASWAMVRGMSSVLYGVMRIDARAARVDPLEALRTE